MFFCSSPLRTFYSSPTPQLGRARVGSVFLLGFTLMLRPIRRYAPPSPVGEGIFFLCSSLPSAKITFLFSPPQLGSARVGSVFLLGFTLKVKTPPVTDVTSSPAREAYFFFVLLSHRLK